MTFKIIVWEVMCVILFWSVFCRSVRVTTATRLDVRLAILLLGLASLVGFGAPLYGWSPDFVTLVIMAPVVIMQVVTARHWSDGVPA